MAQETYRIDGKVVDKAQFEALKSRLKIEERMRESLLARPYDEDLSKDNPETIRHERGNQMAFDAIELKSGKEFEYTVIMWQGGERMYEIRPVKQKKKAKKKK